MAQRFVHRVQALWFRASCWSSILLTAAAVWRVWQCQRIAYDSRCVLGFGVLMPSPHMPTRAAPRSCQGAFVALAAVVSEVRHRVVTQPAVATSCHEQWHGACVHNACIAALSADVASIHSVQSTGIAALSAAITSVCTVQSAGIAALPAAVSGVCPRGALATSLRLMAFGAGAAAVIAPVAASLPTTTTIALACCSWCVQ